jgi:hypothetical protein
VCVCVCVCVCILMLCSVASQDDSFEDWELILKL